MSSLNSLKYKFYELLTTKRVVNNSTYCNEGVYYNFVKNS